MTNAERGWADTVGMRCPWCQAPVRAVRREETEALKGRPAFWRTVCDGCTAIIDLYASLGNPN